ncbi:MAG: hypothetical protein LBG80_18770 [Bacteroidales bacterium]|jgi:hypothetical protein|nr:hypothetical protein [Bacteroidales bacterium]
MAKQKRNLLTQGMSGKIGGIVFRQKDGQTIISIAPEKKTKEPSEKQKKHQERFQKATIYAKKVMANLKKKAAYEEAAKEKKATVYTIAVADFLNSPDIQEVDLTGYTGEIDSEITIVAVDDFLVAGVHVEIYLMDGSLLEEGEAVEVAKNVWVYKATQNSQDLTGAKIIVSASDLPGNITKEDITL